MLFGSNKSLICFCISISFLEKTMPLAEGSNTVNTILVDFRGVVGGYTFF